jgi:hypothetical protein
VLSVLGPGALQWTWGGTDPDTWRYDSSINGVTLWGEFGSNDGSARSDDVFVSGTFYRIVGLDPAGHEITNMSDVVFLPT